MKFIHKKRHKNGTREIFVLGIKVFKYKKKIYRPYIPSLSHIAEECLPAYLAKRFYERTGKLPTEKLVTLQEKVIWASMFDATPLKIQCTDKLAVREYVTKTIGEKYLPKLYAVYKNSDEFDIDVLPQSFVLTHNAGANADFTKLIFNKNEINIPEIKTIIRKWMLYNHSEPMCEMQYRYIPTCVIARELLDIRPDVEYKCWCFNGRVEFIAQNSYVKGHNSVGFSVYSKTGKNLNFYQVLPGSYYNRGTTINQKILDEMVSVAEKLAAPFNFVRVDFYETRDGKLMFGELTFSPSAGNLEFEPNNDEIQTKYGDMFIMPPRDNNGFAIHE